MNTQLIEYGIQTEESDYRAHVGFKTGRVFIFETKVARELVLSGKYGAVPARQPGVSCVTAMGCAVPVSDIDGIKEMSIPQELRHRYLPLASDDTSAKGKKAQDLVADLIRTGRFQLPHKCLPASTEIQIRGADIIATSEFKIQVKCDMRAGSKSLGGTGNLFLQVAECNPLKKI